VPLQENGGLPFGGIVADVMKWSQLMHQFPLGCKAKSTNFGNNKQVQSHDVMEM
jgi:hypothetical protein